jgi:hypothetical protein
MLREVLLSLLNFSFWLALPAAALKLWRSIYRPREWEPKGACAVCPRPPCTRRV